MGGSLARALSEVESGPVVVGWSPAEVERLAAVESGAVSSAPSDWTEAVAGSELVVLAAPLRASCELVPSVVEATSPETTITDVGSLKAPVAQAVVEAGAEERWVGSHPMTGSEESGFEASRADLYSGARVWIVAHPAAAARVARVEALWSELGARPRRIDAEPHDRLMALASHLPQLASNVLAGVLSEGGVSPDELGPGGADMTRLAASGSAMWRDIFEHASPELILGLKALGATSARVADLLEQGDLDGIEELMNATRAWRRPA